MKVTRGGGQRISLQQTRLNTLLYKAQNWHGHFKKHEEGLESLLQLRQSYPTHTVIPELEFRYFEYHADLAISLEARYQISSALRHCQCVLKISPGNYQFLQMKERLGGTITRDEVDDLARIIESRRKTAIALGYLVEPKAPAASLEDSKATKSESIKPEPAKPKLVKARKPRRKRAPKPQVSVAIPENIDAYCLDYLTRLQVLYPFLADEKEAPFEQMPIILLQERLVQRRQVIAFLRENEDLSFSDLKEKSPEICFLFDGKYNRRGVFSGFREARVAAGLEVDRALLAKNKGEIKEAFDEVLALSYEDLQKKWSLWQQAEKLFEQGDYEEATDSFQRATKTDPDDLKLLCRYYISRFKCFSDKRSLRAIKRLKQRLEAITFLRENQDCTATFLQKNNLRMFSLLTHAQESSGVFNRVSDARVAAGIVRSPDKLRQLRQDIKQEHEGLVKLLDRKQQEAKRGTLEIAAAAEESFAHGAYAKAAVLFGQLAELDPSNISAIAYHYYSTLRWEFGFLPSFNLSLFDAGTREEIEEQAEAARQHLEPFYLQAQEGKEALFKEADNLYKARQYQRTADLLGKLLRESDPHDVMARCLYYLSLLHLRHEFIGPVLRKEIRYSQKYKWVIFPARKLRRRMEAIDFFREHPDLTHVRGVRALDRGVASSIGAGADFRVFNRVAGARIAAGIITNSPVLEEVIFQIDEEMKPLKIDLLI